MPCFRAGSAVRRIAMAAAAVLALALTGVWQSHRGALAAAGLDKPITIVVTFPPGGGTDWLARRLGAALQQRMGQSVVVENRPGASGNIGAREVARAAADGSVLLMVNSAFAINPGVYRQLDFDPLRDFRAVFNAGTIASVLVQPPERAVQKSAAEDSATQDSAVAVGTPSLTEALAPSADGAAPAIASCGNGTPQHMAAEMLAHATHARLQHVPYKGCGPAALAVAAGQVPVGVVTISTAASLIADGRLRALAVTGRQRSAQLAGVPTLAELGVADFAVEQWHGLLAPAATPAPVIDRLHRLLAQILAEPEMQQALREQGYVPGRESAAQFGQLIAADMARYAAVTAQLGLKVD